MKLSLNMKLFLLALVPLIGLLYFAGSKLYDEYNYKYTLEKIKNGMEFNQRISSLIEEIQKERLLSLKFVLDKKEFDENLIVQRKKVDRAIEELEKFANNVNLEIFPREIFPKIDASLSLLSQLTEQRKYIDNLNISTDMLIDYYSDINSNLLDLLSLTVKNSYHDSKLSSLLYSYTLFMPINETVDLKSVVLLESMNRGGIKYSTLVKLIQTIAAQKVLNKEFLNTLPEEIKNKIDPFFKKFGKNDEERIKILSLNKNPEEVLRDIDINEWYDSVSKRNKKIKSLQKEFIDKIYGEIQKSSSKSLYGVIVAAVVILLTLILFISVMFHLPEFKFQLDYFKSRMRRRFRSWSEY
ncbi:MAG: hypothetical protein GXO31_03085 [Epsilonproteobacteria bacterium]|nr:hypothetical protein [Campylobacterota bacterium]